MTQNDDVPHVNSISSLNLQSEESVPVYFAIVSSGDIAFVSLVTLDLPDLR